MKNVLRHDREKNICDTYHVAVVESAHAKPICPYGTLHGTVCISRGTVILTYPRAASLPLKIAVAQWSSRLEPVSFDAATMIEPQKHSESLKHP